MDVDIEVTELRDIFARCAHGHDAVLRIVNVDWRIEVARIIFEVNEVPDYDKWLWLTLDCEGVYRIYWSDEWTGIVSGEVLYACRKMDKVHLAVAPEFSDDDNIMRHLADRDVSFYIAANHIRARLGEIGVFQDG